MSFRNTQQNAPNEVPKRRRGRPKKNPEPISEPNEVEVVEMKLDDLNPDEIIASPDPAPSPDALDEWARHYKDLVDAYNELTARAAAWRAGGPDIMQIVRADISEQIQGIENQYPECKPSELAGLQGEHKAFRKILKRLDGKAFDDEIGAIETEMDKFRDENAVFMTEIQARIEEIEK